MLPIGASEWQRVRICGSDQTLLPNRFRINHRALIAGLIDGADAEEVVVF